MSTSSSTLHNELGSYEHKSIAELRVILEEERHEFAMLALEPSGLYDLNQLRQHHLKTLACATKVILLQGILYGKLTGRL